MTPSRPDPRSVPTWPVVRLRLDRDGRAAVDGAPIEVPPGGEPWTALYAVAARYATVLGRPVRVLAEDDAGARSLLVLPDGTVQPVPGDADPGPRPAPAPAATNAPPAPPPRPAPPGPPVPPGPAAPSAPTPPRSRPAVAPAASRPPRTLRSGASGAEGALRPPRTLRLRAGALAWVSRRPGRTARGRARSRLGVLVVGGAGLLAGVLIATQLDGGPSVGGSGATGTVGAAFRQGRLTPPPGYSGSPGWCTAVAAASHVVGLADGTVLARLVDGSPALLDPRTGAVRWQSSVPAADDLVGPWLVRLDDRRAAALSRDGLLTYWFLPDAARTRTEQDRAPVGVGLPPGTTVNLAGPSPLVTLDDGSPAVIRAGAKVRVLLPAGARAVAADRDTVLAVRGATWARLRAGDGTGVWRRLPVPSGARGEPVRVEAVGADHLATIWTGPGGKGRVVGVLDLRTGELGLQARLAAGVDPGKAPVLRAADGSLTAIGPVLIDPARGLLVSLDPAYQVVTLLPGHAYTRLHGQVVDLQVNGQGTVNPVVYPAGPGPVIPVGVAGSGPDRRALVLVGGTGTLLCGLPPG